MLRHIAHKHRRGAAAVEFALVAPIALFLVLAIMIGGQGVFRYQQVAALAREGARWASVHGGEYEKVTGNPAATPKDVFDKAILPYATLLRPEYLSYAVTWDRSNMPLQVFDDVQQPIGNTVTVTVSYEWFPEIYLVGPFNLNSSSTAQMNF